MTGHPLIGFIVSQLALGGALSLGFLTVLWAICPLDIVAMAARNGSLGALGAAGLAGAVAPFAMAFTATALELHGRSGGDGGGSFAINHWKDREKQNARKVESTTEGGRGGPGGQAR